MALSMFPPRLHRSIHYLIALVWLVNGLLCKVLLLVPRHATIVARILGPTHAEVLTRLIGLGEIGIAVWVLSGWRPRWCVAVQICLVLSMNTLEALLAPDLLLWGRANAVFAALFCLLLYLHGGRRARSSVS
ncbi:DoxX-like family protein [Hymenobacter sp. ASUV-10]|uniref:DoxX-like family protein n=1 Tax=Hymenobacter aranciens TaxID=3063996 RepID=A0ABT9BHL0_9BACT|nr:DoxX-like family protein [Hymenobacter sp. ASUV-10]MDO7876492.1 DoxX-like family protein [Hymenobacter sp. ASUV-10]